MSLIARFRHSRAEKPNYPIPVGDLAYEMAAVEADRYGLVLEHVGSDWNSEIFWLYRKGEMAEACEHIHVCNAALGFFTNDEAAEFSRKVREAREKLLPQSKEPREIRWYDRSQPQFCGKYVVLEGDTNNGKLLKLHRHVFPDGTCTYLALPADEEQLRAFIVSVVEPLAAKEQDE